MASILRLIFVGVLLASLAASDASAQTDDASPKKIDKDALKIDVEALLKTLPTADGQKDTSGADATAAATDANDANSDDPEPIVDVISKLETQIDEMSQRRLDRSEGQKLKQLKLELKASKKILSQLKRTKLVRKKRESGTANDQDAFVIAQIEVPQGGDTANVSFSSLAGEMDTTKELLSYLVGTPDGGFRDYRIISRHSSDSDAIVALDLSRKEYDAMKERERQMLAYISARNAQMARIKRSKRC